MPSFTISTTHPPLTHRTTAPLNATVATVTEAIRARSTTTRAAYLERLDGELERASQGRRRSGLGCPNLAHGMAACSPEHKLLMADSPAADVAIVTAYNDVLSAHQPFETYPAILRQAVAQAGGVAQVAGGVPAMCDGVTQGRRGMELSLLSREIIAMSTAVALSHELFDAVLLLGVCDKIAPGMLIGALSFGELPTLFVPSGPMPSGLGNAEKTRIREHFAAGEVSRRELLEAESKAYHSPGTCTFYGTANSNQMVLEAMGLHLPGSTFITPGTCLRQALTECAGRRAVEIADPSSPDFAPVGRLVDERAIVNGIVTLLATGGSTNLTMHLVAVAAAAGIRVTWDDFDALSTAVPLLARVYPNGGADINHFQAAGGLGFVISQLLDAGLLHPDVLTVAGAGLDRYRYEPRLDGDALAWVEAPTQSLDHAVLRPVTNPFTAEGGLKILGGNLGRAVMKVSSLDEDHHVIQAPARVFDDQEQVHAAFTRGELERDVVVVVREQGPRANGMPELHKLTPLLGILQRRGHRVALVTDGRMSGASGRVPIAMHVSPEAADGGALALVRDGDLIRVDSVHGTLEVDLPEAELSSRTPQLSWRAERVAYGVGRELMGALRAALAPAEQGAGVGTAALQTAL